MKMKHFFHITLLLLMSSGYLYPSLPFKQITVLTKPIGCTENRWFHQSVVRSIVQGLEKIKVPFNINPRHLADVGDVVWVINDDEALLQAIELRKKGVIACLLAGPNFVILPHENNRILTREMIDGVIVPAAAIKQIYVEDEPSLANHTYVCPTGVDTDFWNPDKKNSTGSEVLIYWKTESEEFCRTIQRCVEKNGWIPRLIRYGQYNHDSFCQMLMPCRFAIFISRSESQGIALAESWAMNVPTLVWNPYAWEYKGQTHPLSSCPYLNPMLGQEWNTIEELDLILKGMPRRLQCFAPRAWVLDHMSDQASAYQLLNIITQIMRKNAS